MAVDKVGRRKIIDTSSDSWGPFGVPNSSQLAMAAGWEPGPMPAPPFPDPPPVTVELQERILVVPGDWPATSSQVLTDCLDTGGRYSGGLAQVIFYADTSLTSTQEYTLTTCDGGSYKLIAPLRICSSLCVSFSRTTGSGGRSTRRVGRRLEATSLLLLRP